MLTRVQDELTYCHSSLLAREPDVQAPHKCAQLQAEMQIADDR